MTLLSAVLELAATADATVPPHLGRAAHAVLLGLVAEVRPDRAADLHDGEGTRPFTASSLLGLPADGGAEGRVEAGRVYHLRFTALEPDLAGTLKEILGRLPGRRLHLEGAELEVKGATWSPEGHPWAAETTYEEMAVQHLTGEAPPARVALHFATPTTFRSGGRNVPLPLPGLVFGSLLERWNRFAPVELCQLL